MILLNLVLILGAAPASAGEYDDLLCNKVGRESRLSALQADCVCQPQFKPDFSKIKIHDYLAGGAISPRIPAGVKTNYVDDSNNQIRNRQIQNLLADLDKSWKNKTSAPDSRGIFIPGSSNNEQMIACLKYTASLEKIISEINLRLEARDDSSGKIIDPNNNQIIVITKNVRANPNALEALHESPDAKGFKSARVFKDLYGKPFPGNDDKAQSIARLIHAVDVRRLLVLGGSDAVDAVYRKGLPPSPSRIPGFLSDGVNVDLDTSSDPPIAIKMGPGWVTPCGGSSFAKGVCVVDNQKNQVWPAKDGSYPVHQCGGEIITNSTCQLPTKVSGDGASAPQDRGQIGTDFTFVMRSISDSIQTQQKIPDIKDFGIQGSKALACDYTRIQIEQGRIFLDSIAASLKKGVTNGQNADIAQCPDSEATELERKAGSDLYAWKSKLTIDGQKKATVTGGVPVSCLYSKAALDIDRLVMVYMGCVSTVVFNEIKRIRITTMVTQNEEPLLPIYAQASLLSLVLGLSFTARRRRSLAANLTLALLLLVFASACDDKEIVKCGNICDNTCPQVKTAIEQYKSRLTTLISQLKSDSVANAARIAELNDKIKTGGTFDVAYADSLKACKAQPVANYPHSDDASSENRDEACACPGVDLAGAGAGTAGDQIATEFKETTDQIAALHIGGSATNQFAVADPTKDTTPAGDGNISNPESGNAGGGSISKDLSNLYKSSSNSLSKGSGTSSAGGGSGGSGFGSSGKLSSDEAAANEQAARANLNATNGKNAEGKDTTGSAKYLGGNGSAVGAGNGSGGSGGSDNSFGGLGNSNPNPNANLEFGGDRNLASLHGDQRISVNGTPSMMSLEEYIALNSRDSLFERATNAYVRTQLAQELKKKATTYQSSLPTLVAPRTSAK